MYELIASGGILEAIQLSQYETYLAEGDRGLLELDLRLPIPQSIASELEDKLRQAGVSDVSVITASPLLRVYFRKGFPWLAIIAAAVLGLIALAILIIGWRLFREVAEVIPIPILGGLSLGVVIVLILIILALRRI